MKTLTEYKNKKNIISEDFFGNLGIGKRGQVEKWLEENKKYLNDGIDISLDDNNGLIIHVKTVKYVFYARNKIRVPIYISISKIIFDEGSYNNVSFDNLIIDDYKLFMSNAIIEVKDHPSIQASISFVGCNIKQSDLQYLPKEIYTVIICNSDNFTGNIVIKNLPKSVKTIHISNCDIATFSIDSSVKNLNCVNIDKCEKLYDIQSNNRLKYLSIRNSIINNDIIDELENISGESLNDIKNKKVYNKVNKSLQKSILLKELIEKFPLLSYVEISIHNKYKTYINIENNKLQIEYNEITDY